MVDDQAPRSVEELEERLSRPSQRVVEAFRALPGDLVVLGAGGKMGPTLTRMAARAAELAGGDRRITAVSRFSQSRQRQMLEDCGVRTVACDLLDPDSWKDLPDAPLVLHLPAFKFGASADPARAWATHCFLPALTCRRYRDSRIVAFSTGNVYPLSPVEEGGCDEGELPSPIGEYAMSALGRERIFEHFSRAGETPLVLLRLNYAVELRYGVLVDLALSILEGREIDLTMGHVNVIWQGDANAAALCALAAARPGGGRVLNLAGPEILAVRELCRQLGELLSRQPRTVGREAANALLSDGSAGRRLWGPPELPAERVVEWVAQWLLAGHPTLDRPTHFQVRDGEF